jgi:membrane fusion protein (multidrug efflux system)
MSSINKTHEKKAGQLKKLRNTRWLLSCIGIMIVLAGIYETVVLMTGYKRSETTNDAQVEQYIFPLNIKVPGYIHKIAFTEHQYVSKGDTLLVIDAREYAIRLKEAEALLKDAQAGENVLHAGINTSRSNASVYEASIAEVEVKLDKLKKDYQRYQNLLERHAVTPMQAEQIKTELDMTGARLDALYRQRHTAQSSVREVSTRKGNAEAAILRASAAVDMARLNLEYTAITAPCNGVLGRRTLEEGQLVSAGQTVTYIIPDNRKWVVANFKETQMKNLYVGQAIQITIDAFADREFTGHITAISGATGSKYSLVPADNATGNFIKIQQRVPVRIDFDDLPQDENRRIAAGMMATVKAKLK